MTAYIVLGFLVYLIQKIMVLLGMKEMLRPASLVMIDVWSVYIFSLLNNIHEHFL